MLASVPVEYRTLFLGDLSVHCNDQHIQQFFAGYGLIEQIRLKHASMSQCLSYAFITFVFRRDAEKALQELNGTMLLGRKIRMNWATPKNSSGANIQIKPSLKVKENPDNLSTAQIHFSFIAKNVNGIVTEETIRDLFSGFGPIVDVAMKKCEIDPVQNVQSGYGFLHYPMSMEGIRAAIFATNTIQKIAINQIRYDSCLTRSLQKLVDETPELRRLSHARRPAPAKSVSPPRMQMMMNVPQQQMKRPSIFQHEDLDMNMEVLSLTESDSESSYHSQDDIKGLFSSQSSVGLNSLRREEPTTFMSYQNNFTASFDLPKHWSPARVELSTYGTSSFSTYGPSNHTPSHFAW